MVTNEMVRDFLEAIGLMTVCVVGIGIVIYIISSRISRKNFINELRSDVDELRMDVNAMRYAQNKLDDIKTAFIRLDNEREYKAAKLKESLKEMGIFND